MNGKIGKTSTSTVGVLNQSSTASGVVASGGGGTADHKRLNNRDAADQHPISAITNLQDVLDSKATKTDLATIRAQLADKKAKGLYYDFEKKFSKKAYWYMTSEIDEITNQGNPGSNGEYIVSGPYDLGQGGGGSGGGGGGVTTLTLTNKDPDTGEHLWPSAVAIGDNTVLKVHWTSKRDDEPTGNGTMFVYVNDVLVSKRNVRQGYVECDVSLYIISGTNKIEFKVQDAYSSTKNLIGNIVGVSLKLTSNFEDDVSYTGPITYTYTPIGDIEKTVHFILDGTEIGQDIVRTTGEQCIHIIPTQSHGAHTLEVYFTAELDGEPVGSNHLKYDLVCYTAGDLTPIIASIFDDDPNKEDSDYRQEQYVAFNIKYRVATPSANSGMQNTSAVTLLVNGQQIGTPLTVDTSWQSWEILPTNIGTFIYTIRTGSVERHFNVYVSKSTIEVEVVPTGQVLSLTTYGRSNSDQPAIRQAWKDEAHSVNCTLTGFNWSSNGWVQDNDGATVLRLSGDARVEIPYKPFFKDLQATGKTIEIEFATSDVKKYESRILECLAGGDSLTYTQKLAGEDDRAHYFTVTDVNTDKFIAAVRNTHRTYLFIYNGTDWTLDGAVVDLTSENSAYGITIRQDDRDGGTPSDYFINGDMITVAYLVVGRGIYITPQLAKFQSQLAALSTQYKENEHVYLTFVIENRNENRLIYMYINGIMSGVTQYPPGDTFDQSPAANILLGSNDATLDIYNIRIYDQALSRKQVVNNWIASMRDPVAKATYYLENDNFDETGKVIIDKIPSKTPYMVLTGPALPEYKKDRKFVDVEFVYPGSEDTRNFTATGAQIDVQGTSSQYYYRKNFKINFKEGFYDNEGELQKKIKHIPPLSKKEKKFTFKADVASSEGANNVELVRYFEFTKNFLMPSEQDQDPDDTLDGYETKDRVRTGIDGFPIIMFHDAGDNNPVFYGKMNFNNDKDNKDTFGFSDGDECWEFINNTTPLALFQSDDLTNWDISFESRYPEDYGDDEHTYGTQPGELNKLQTLMTWVASTRRLPTDSEEEKARKLKKFRDEFKRHFNLESSLFYYLYTELFLMVDSRAKNAMLAYLRSHTPGDGGDRWFWLPYDMDTAIGTNNEGLLVFDYDAEDTDIINGAKVYNGQDSVFWCNLRDAFSEELSNLYASLRSGNAENQEMAWSYDNIEKLFEDHQAFWSASIFNEDSYVKYLEPLVNNNDNAYLGMAQGSKAEQRKWWLWNRFRYLDSKYRTGDAAAKNIMIRAYQKASLDIVPYINCYITARFDQNNPKSIVTVDALKDTPYTITPPADWNPDAVDSVFAILSADLIKDIGNISGLKPGGYLNLSAATKLQRLQIGNAADGYTNNKLESLSVGNNRLLTYLDARNCTALGTGDIKTVDLSNCVSIEECYFDNTNIQGVSFPVGGNLKEIHLPASITDLTIRNHPNLTRLVLAGTGRLTSVWLEDVPSEAINAVSIVSAMDDGSSVRLININETINDVATLNQFYNKLSNMKGKDNKGDTTEKAQVTGTIHLPDSAPISYAEWVRLSNMFDEVTIDAKIICTVRFLNEGAEYLTVNIASGSSVAVPDAPTKPSTAQHYYTFNSWDKPFNNVTTDLTINAIYDKHIQRYTIHFDTRSNLIQVNPESIELDYGSTVPEPTIVQATVPSGVNFLGWYTDANDLFDFSSRTVTGSLLNYPTSMHITLSARWQDENFPSVTVTPVTFNKFAYHATDNMGVSGWAVNNSQAAPALSSSEWHAITPTTVFDGEYTINAAGDYYFHVKDDQGNKSWAKIHASTIELSTDIHNERDLDIDLVQLRLTEAGAPVTTFALDRTLITINAIFDSHYENLTLTHSGTPLVLGQLLEITEDTVIYASVYPKSYTVTFDKNGLGTTPMAQTIVYKHLVEAPTPQAVNGKALVAWFDDNDNFWDFDTSEVLGNTTLTAKWEEITTPTGITLSLTEPNTLVSINFTQTASNGVEIDWGDGSEPERSENTGAITLTHTYVDALPATINVSRKEGTYLFGHNYDVPAITPINIVSDLNFAWDVPYTNPGAFRGAVFLGSVHLTKFMTRIAASMFEDCTNMTIFKTEDSRTGEVSETYAIPNSITNIGARAFAGCDHLRTVIFPNKLQELGENAFRNCALLSSVTFYDSCPLTVINDYTFAGCTTLHTVNVPSYVNTISDSAFLGCRALTAINLGASVTTLGSQVFAFCTSLNNVILQAQAMTIGSGCFQDCPQLLTAGPIGGNYNINFAWKTKIPDRAFSASSIGGVALTTITLPNNLIEIGDNAFSYCSHLASISLPSGLEKIGHSAFYYCSSLQTIVIPPAVTSIGSNAFRSCFGLVRVDLWAASSSIKVNNPEAAWFWDTNEETIDIHILKRFSTDKTIEESIELINSAFGSYWNYTLDNHVLPYTCDLVGYTY